MSYLDSVLQPDEELLSRAHRHWITYIRPILFGLLGLVVLVSSPIGPEDGVWRRGLGTIVLLAAFISFLRTWLTNWTSELAVTNRRVIYKTGFINRKTIEMNMDKVETVSIEQTLLGHLLDYGTVHVKGTGQSIENLWLIAQPVAVRNSIAAR